MKTTDTPLRVLIADGSHDFMDVARRWLILHPCVGTVSAVYSGVEALETVGAGQVDLVLLDARLPDMDGFEATRQIKSTATPPLVVILVLFDYQAVRDEAAAAGADACIDKTVLTRALSPVLPGFMEQITERQAPGKPTAPP